MRLFFVVFLLSFFSANSQTFYSVDYKSQADINVFVVDYKSQADLLVYKVDYNPCTRSNKTFSLVTTTDNSLYLFN